MIQRVKKLLAELDAFSFPLGFTVNDIDNTSYKSFIGGLATLLIYMTALTYLIYLIVSWSWGEFLPKVTSEKSITRDKMDISFDFSPVIMRLDAPGYNLTSKKRLYDVKLSKYVGFGTPYETTNSTVCDFVKTFNISKCSENCKFFL